MFICYRFPKGSAGGAQIFKERWTERFVRYVEPNDAQGIACFLYRNERRSLSGSAGRKVLLNALIDAAPDNPATTPAEPPKRSSFDNKEKKTHKSTRYFRDVSISDANRGRM